MFRAFLSFLAFQHCLAAVTWRPIGCDNWNFQGASIDQIWDNAIVMATKARAQLDVIPNGPATSEAKRWAGANAEFMFGVSFSRVTGLASSSQAAIQTAKDMYDAILNGLQGKADGLDVGNAFVFCGANGLNYAPIPQDPDQQPIWHGEVQIGVSEPPPNAPGTITEFVSLGFTRGKPLQPCTEAVNEAYLGKTFSAVQNIEGVLTSSFGIILCTNQYAAGNVPVSATLSPDFTATIRGGNRYATPGEYNSVAGTLIHEMAHVVGRLRGTHYGDLATGFVEGVALAKGTQDRALINPDNYRVFAEMSMSPLTRWGAPGM